MGKKKRKTRGERASDAIEIGNAVAPALTDKQVANKAVEAFFKVHLPYEVWMLDCTIKELNSDPPRGPVYNALIESFCLHARNLADFLTNKPTCDFDPRDFTDPPFKSKPDFLPKKLYNAINAQITHLSKHRTSDPQFQIDDSRREQILSHVHRDLDRFRKNLKRKYQELWTESPSIAKPQTLGATGDVIVIGDSPPSTSSSFMLNQTDFGNTPAKPKEQD